MKSKSSIDCTARCCMPQTMAFVLSLKNLRVCAFMALLGTESFAKESSAEIGGSLIDCGDEPIP